MHLNIRSQEDDPETHTQAQLLLACVCVCVCVSMCVYVHMCLCVCLCVCRHFIPNYIKNCITYDIMNNVSDSLFIHCLCQQSILNYTNTVIESEKKVCRILFEFTADNVWCTI